MTRKVTFIALALACAALLAPAGAGAAAPDSSIRESAGSIRAAALFPGLTERTARRLGLKLARETARDRDVRWWTLSEAVSQSSTRIVFVYTDRSRNNVFCTSEIVVSQPHRRFRQTRFTDGRCRGVPTEALRIEDAGARFIRALVGETADVSSASADVLDEVLECDTLRVPRSRRADVATLFAAFETVALNAAIEVPVDAFRRELSDINPQLPGLAPAVTHWIAVLNRTTMLAIHLNETLGGDSSPCRVLRRWARAGWSGDARPEGIANLAGQLRGLAAAERGLIRAGRQLAALGVSPRGAGAFSQTGALAVATPPNTCAGVRVGCPGPG